MSKLRLFVLNIVIHLPNIQRKVHITQIFKCDYKISKLGLVQVDSIGPVK